MKLDKLPNWLKKDEQTGKYSVDGKVTFNEVMEFIINSLMELNEEIEELWKEIL